MSVHLRYCSEEKLQRCRSKILLLVYSRRSQTFRRVSFSFLQTVLLYRKLSRSWAHGKTLVSLGKPFRPSEESKKERLILETCPKPIIYPSQLQSTLLFRIIQLNCRLRALNINGWYIRSKLLHFHSALSSCLRCFYF